MSDKIEKIKESLKNTILENKGISNELENSFMEYAMSVIVARAIPDARDGFKPIHRRVLYAAHGLGITYDKPHKKSARIVGEIIGKYHPHGDTAAYETMVRMAQDFSLRYPLIDGHGNFGSIDGDSAAAMRYTEARLSKISGEMLADLEKNTVDFIDNYDGSEQEPVVLPSLFPNLLANGSSGIAVGMATNIPPHNLSELIDATLLIAKNPNATILEIKEHLKGPDFPTSAEIVGTSGIDQYFETGRGSVTVRSKVNIEEMDNGKSRLIVSEIPYQVNKTVLIQRIVDLVKNNQIDGIADMRDESSLEGIRIIIETKRDVVPEVLLNKLYKHTQLQTNFSVNLLALVDGQPKLLNIKEAIEIYIKHQIEVLTRKTIFELKKAQDREHILNGIHIATQNVDAIIKMIRESKDNDEAMEILKSRYNLSDVQVKAILDMRLRTLSGLEREKIEEELKELSNNIANLNNILSNENKKIDVICDNLLQLKKKYGDERKTNILYGVSSDIDTEDLIPVEDIVVTLSSRGYMKRMPVDVYRLQNRGGVGVIGMQTHNDDDVEKIIVTSTHTDLLIFSNLGKVYRIRGHQVPQGSRQSKGIPAINIIGIDKTEKILSILPIDDYSSGYLFFTTINGLVKKTSLNEFTRINSNGKIAITLKENDKLFSVIKVNDNEEIYLGGSNGNLVRFNENQVRSMGRTAAGVKGMSLPTRDYIIGLSNSSMGDLILSIGQHGVGKLTPVNEYRLTKRGAKGVTTLKVSNKTGKLVYTSSVKGDEDILLITSSGKIIRFSLTQVNQIGRATSGVKLMNIDDNEKIQSVACFKKEFSSNDQQENN